MEAESAYYYQLWMFQHYIYKLINLISAGGFTENSLEVFSPAHSQRI